MRKSLLLAVLALVAASCGGGDSSDNAGTAGPPNASDGEKVFEKTCVPCHGRGGVGVAGLGKPMPGSAFIASLSDAQLVDFIKTGRDSDHPDNTTGVDMPPSGGRDLSEQDLVDVAAYVRTLN